VHYCKECGNFTEGEVCDICKERSKNVICVVKEPKDIISIERLGEFEGVYHVLHGLFSPKDGIGMENLPINSLLERIKQNNTKEVIIATGTNVEGDATALAISYYVKPLGVKVTRLAQGIPIGTEIEYADEGSLARAFNERKDL
jgi:recombination protein RecR